MLGFHASWRWCPRDVRIPRGAFGAQTHLWGELRRAEADIREARSNAETCKGTFLAPYDIVPFDEACAREHSRLRHALRHSPIGERDLFIAATAMSRRLTVVTANLSEFLRVPGLQVEDWASS